MSEYRNNKVWELPFPPTIDKEEYVWRPTVKRMGNTIPFGYKLDPENPQQMLPIPEELTALEEAKEHLKQYSLRKVAAWLSETTGRSISAAGLKWRVDHDRKFAKESAIKDYYIEKAKEYIRAAERLEEKRRGPVGYKRNENLFGKADELKGSGGTDTISGGGRESSGDYLQSKPWASD